MSNTTVKEYLAEVRNAEKNSKNHGSNSNIQSWKIEKINSSLLKSKQPYQRNISTSFIKNAVDTFDPNLLDPVHVSYRDGKYYTIDGQHTIIIYEAMNGGKSCDIPCVVHRGMTYTDEAEYYVNQYRKKHRHTYGEMAIASYESGDDVVCSVASDIRSVGARMSFDKKAKSGMKISAVKKVISLYKKDTTSAILAVKYLVEAYKDRDVSINGDIIAGVMEFLRLYGSEIDIARLIRTLSTYTQQGLLNTARNFNTPFPINWTETIRNKYNDLSKRGKIKYKNNTVVG